MDEQSHSRFRPKPPQTGPLPKDRGTKPLSPIEKRAAKEAEPDHWQNLEERAADIRGTIWDFVRDPSVDHIDIVDTLIDTMSESWKKIASEELEKLPKTEKLKAKETTDKEKLQARFEGAFDALLPKKWNELPRTERVKIYNQLFTAHTALKEISAYPVALIMQKAKITYQETKKK